MSTEDLVIMAQFILNNHIFEFNSKKYQQKLTVAIGTKFVSPPSLYTYIYVYQVEEKFWKIQRQTFNLVELHRWDLFYLDLS